jgi:hypothetical protein
MPCCARWAAATFGLDVRSLAAYRMAVASTVFYVTLLRIVDVDAFLSDRGMMPRLVKMQSDPGSLWAINLHLLSGHGTVLSLVFLLHAAILVCMFVGYRTRAATVVLFVLEVSVQNRNHLVLQGGDNVVRVAHCFAMFLPIGEVWSVDAWLRKRHREKRRRTAARRRNWSRHTSATTTGAAASPVAEASLSKAMTTSPTVYLPSRPSPPHPRASVFSRLFCLCVWPARIAASIMLATTRHISAKLGCCAHCRRMRSFFRDTSPPASQVGAMRFNHNVVCSAGTVAYTLQVVVFYLFAGLLKNPHRQWTKDYDALSKSLHSDEFTTYVGRFLRDDMPRWVLVFLTRASHMLELWCPLLVLLPLRMFDRQLGAMYRGFAVISFFLFHIGIRACMDIGHFSYISMALWTAFIPGEFWESSCCVKCATRRLSSSPPSLRPPLPPSPSPSLPDGQHYYNKRVSQLPMWGKVFIGAVLYCVLGENMATYYKDEQATYLPVVGPFRVMSKVMRLDQRWAMFNNPISEDGWYEATGVLRNNATLDLMGWGGPLPKKLRFPFPEDYSNPALVPQSSMGQDRPKWFVRRFASQRWRKFLPYLRQKKHKQYRREYGKYLCRTWNGPGYGEDKKDLGQLLTFKLRFYPEALVCEDESDAGGRKTGFCKNKQDPWTLWTHKCF